MCDNGLALAVCIEHLVCVKDWCYSAIFYMYIKFYIVCMKSHAVCIKC